MEDSIRRAAEWVQYGNHAEAERLIAELQAAGDLNAIVAAIERDPERRETPYYHFVSLKLLRILLVRQRAAWIPNKAQLLQFLVGYAHSLGERIFAPEWRPTVAELTSGVAVMLKLGTIAGDGSVVNGEVANVVEALAQGAVFSGPVVGSAVGRYFHRLVVQRTVEEFGLFDAPSRHRGLPLRLHRQCREEFQSGDRLPLLVLSVLGPLCTTIPGTEPETKATIHAGLAAVTACLSWPLHRFFEEQSAVDESCVSFPVSGAVWERLVFEPLAAGTPDLFGVLSSCYVAQAINGVPLERQQVAEIAQLLCSLKGDQWDAPRCVAFLSGSFSLCMNIFESITVNADPADFHILPTMSNSLLRLVSNYTEHVLSPEMVPLLGKYAEMTKYLVAWDAQGDDDSVMSSLDEALSAWFHLALFIDRERGSCPASGPMGEGDPLAAGRAVMRGGCGSIFTSYIHCKTAAGVVDEDEDGFADAFTNSHLELIAHIGRVSPPEACAVIVETLTKVGEHVRGASSAGLGEAAVMQLNEAVWLVLRVTGFFIADKADGEQPYIPRCFHDEAAAPALLQVVRCLLSVATVLFEAQSVITSPAVYAAYADALRAYCRSYVDPEEGMPAALAGAADSGAEFVSFALHFASVALRAMPFEQGAMDAVCALLDCVADKGSSVHAFVVAQPSFQTIAQFATKAVRCDFVGHTRGRLLGFLVSCSAVDGEEGRAAASGALNSLLLSSQRRDSTVEELLDCLTSVAGLFESLKRQNAIRAVFAPVMSVTESLLHSSFTRFSERDLAIELVQCVQNMFSTCVCLLENDSILKLLQLVVETQRRACESLSGNSTWKGAEAENDRTAFLSWIGRLLTSISQWKILDCFLPDETVEPVAVATVDALAVLLDCLDQRSLSFPALEETLFTSLEVCTEAFPAHIVFSPKSSTFFSATFYALTSERASTQRCGVLVASHAADCLQQSTSQGQGGGGLEALLQVLLRSLVTGKVQMRNVRVVARTTIKLVSKMGNVEAASPVLATVAGEFPTSHAFLEALHGDLANALHMSARGASNNDFVQSFEDRLEDNLSLMAGTSLV